MSVCISHEPWACIYFREHMALLRRAEGPATRAINMTLLRRGGRNGQTINCFLQESGIS